MVIIRDAKNYLPGILDVHRQAFGGQKGEVISKLVGSLLEDETAKPVYSLAAIEQDTVIGHVLFTRVTIVGGGKNFSGQILAPLAVLPDWQKRSVGTQLVKTGIEILKKDGVGIIFVLGHPGYYPRCGFTPVGKHGFEAPYTIPDEYSDAWMVQALRPGIIGTERGKVQCADSLNRPEHWRE